jgi:hypothetical protein
MLPSASRKRYQWRQSLKGTSKAAAKASRSCMVDAHRQQALLPRNRTPLALTVVPGADAAQSKADVLSEEPSTWSGFLSAPNLARKSPVSHGPIGGCHWFDIN